MVKEKDSNKPLSPEMKVELEKAFLLDCVALGTLAGDSSSYSPKLATGIPPYNSQKDKTVKHYFRNPVVKKTLKKNGQDRNGGESMSGKQADYFHEKGSMGKYLSARNASGYGYSTREVAGHDLFMSNPTPVRGYNGDGGYRKNTPDLRSRPSVFEVRKR